MLKIIVITFALLVSTTSISVRSLVEQNLANIIRKSNGTINRNPKMSSQCFSTYSPKLSALTLEFEAEYERCAQTAQNDTDCANRKVQPDLATVDQLRENLCSGLSDCIRDKDHPYDSFECYNAAASEAITQSYRIQTISSAKMQYLILKYEVIKYDKYTCTQKCSQMYVEETAKVQTELQDCLNGKIPVVTTTTNPPEYHESTVL